MVKGMQEVIDVMEKAKADLDANGGLKQVIFVACGGSFASSYPARYLLGQESSLKVLGYNSSEFVNATPRTVGPNTLVIATSTKATAETVEALRRAGLFLPERADFNPIREHAKPFRTMTEEEWEQAIAKDPRYGRIICRCETVTEAEIAHAIERTLGKPTVDGVKRRTRAGMGRCQGGFCGPRVMELIEKYGGIPMEKITKNGGASRMIVGRTMQEER